MPVRHPRNWGGNIIGSFPSLKRGQPVPYESTIERDLLFFLEYDPTVLLYEMQPLTITITDEDGTTHRYTPDVQIIRTTGRELVECKPAALLDRSDAQRQITIGQAWAEVNDHDFVVVTDKDLRTGPRLANLKLLWRYARLAAPYTVLVRCRDVLAAYPNGLPFATLHALLDSTTLSQTLPPYLYSLLFHHVLIADLDQPLTAHSPIRLASFPV